MSESRPLSTIAREITAHWPKPNYAAVPYLNALHSMGDIKDAYGADSGASVVAYFLSNASTWRGEAARRIKAELKQLLKGA